MTTDITIDSSRPDPKEINFNDLGGQPILMDEGDYIDPDTMAELPEIGHAAMAAIQNIDVPNGSLEVYQLDDDTVRVANIARTMIEGGEGSSIHLETPEVIINNANFHEVGAYIDITTTDSGYNVDIHAKHDGTYGPTIDSSRSQIHYEVDGDGNFTSRERFVDTQAFEENPMDQEHGRWTVEAVETLESNYAVTLGHDARADIESQRMEGAAIEITTTPPTAENTVNFSEINFEAATSPPEQQGPTQKLEGLGF